MTATARRDAVSRAAGGRQRRGRAILPSAVPCRARSASRRTAVRCRALRVCCPGLISTVSRVRSGSRVISRDARAERAIPRSSMHHAIADPRRVRRACRPAPTRRVRRATVDLRNVTVQHVYLSCTAPRGRRGVFFFLLPFSSGRGRVGLGLGFAFFASRLDVFRVSCVSGPRTHDTAVVWVVHSPRSAVSIQLEF